MSQGSLLGCGSRRGSCREGRGPAHGGASLLGGECEPQTGRPGVVCEFHSRHGVALAGLLVTMRPGRRGSATSYKPFLHHVIGQEPQRQRAIKLKTSRARPRVLTEPPRDQWRLSSPSSGCCRALI